MGAEVSPFPDSQQNRLMCTLCNQVNPQTVTRCSQCLGSLDSAVLITEEEELLLSSRRDRSLRNKRRIRLLAIVLPLVLLALLVAYNSMDFTVVNNQPSSPMTSTYESQDSVMFQRDNGRTGYADVPNWEPKLDVLWNFETEFPLLSSPAVVDDNLYMATGDGRLVSLNSNTGEIRWIHQVSMGPVESSPAVAGEFGFFGLRDGRLLAVHQDTGQLIWEYDIGYPIYASPIVYGGLLYIGAVDGKIYAIDALNGDLHWDYETGGSIVSSFAIEGDVLVASSRDRYTYVLNSKTGKHRAIFQSGSALENSPVISDGIVYVSAATGLTRAFHATARILPFEKSIRRIWLQLWVWQLAPSPPFPNSHLWVSRVKDRFQGNMALANDTLYMPGLSGKVYAINAATGENKWTFNTKQRMLRSTPLVVGDTLIFGTPDGTVYGLNANSGVEKWQVATEGIFDAAPVFAGQKLYLPAGDGTLYVLH